ncbi:bifunctional metallophosphatase/5'-nucleotidase [Anditalea andensis]|uniref:5'-nucleotidase n=1 Tax=Anditalea andensis TaxID=1048983 RepID=A0A074L4L2_9BACT|nr:metallophosphoesterase [Anditalea andensis]KEO74803.1 5'-nucleotidase [Anditalea andensis]
MDSRRAFLKKTLISGTGMALSGSLMPQSLLAASSKKITILHTNDMHSRIEPFPDDGGTFANMGGMARRATLISEIRAKEPNVLLLDAGDIFQGTPYFNFYGGELEFKLMSKMKYDAATLGNHDFDNGMDGLLGQLPNASFNFISSNYDFSDTLLHNQFSAYKIFNKGGIKIGVFGLGIELEGLVAKENYGNTKYLDPIAVSREMVQQLKNKKCDLIICLSHLGYSYQSQKIDDRKLAAQVNGIDLIIGGHTHTFLDHPEEIINKDGHKTLINQVGWSGLKLGKIDFAFGKKNEISYANSEPLAII